MLKRFILILFATLFITSNAYSHSFPVLYPDLLAMLEESILSQEKKDEVKVLMDEGWALHLKMKADEEVGALMLAVDRFSEKCSNE